MRKGVKEPTVPLNQQYPPGTQEKYNSFQSKIPVMKDGMKPEVTERRGGGKGSGIRFADSDDRGFPLLYILYLL